MGSLYANLVFYFGGMIFANFVPVAKFLFLAPVLALIYFAFIFAVSGQIGPAVIDVIVAFGCVQIGYVSGLALRTVLAALLPRNIYPSQFNAMREKETEIK